MPGESPLPKSVLVVDDEPIVLDVLRLALKKGGYPVTCVASGEAAFEALAKEQFGAVLTDKNLPGKSGLEVIKEARRLHPFCACLLMTGYANTESVVEAMRLGANDYLEKPFSELGLVLQRLKAAFDNQRVAFERAALVDGLRAMEQALRSKEKEVFAHRTEVELLQSVIEMKVEDATSALVVELATVQTERDALQLSVAGLMHRDAVLSKVITDAADRCGKAAKGGLTAEKATAQLADLEKQLAAAVEKPRG